MKRVFMVLAVASILLIGACNSEMKENEVMDSDTIAIQNVDTAIVIDTLVKTDTSAVLK